MKTKKHISILILIIVFAMLSSCGKKTDWNLYDVNGKVKKFVEMHYEPETKFGEWNKGEPIEFGNYSVAFDADGNFEVEDFIGKNGKMKERSIPKKENGEIKEISSYDQNGKLERITKFKHLSETKVEFTTYNPKGEEVGAGKTFLKNGKLVRRDHKTFTNGKVTYEFRVKFQYDENGQVHTIEETNEDGDVKQIRYEYLEFDDQNNWIKRLEYVDDISERPQKLAIRTYTYYEN